MMNFFIKLIFISLFGLLFLAQSEVSASKFFDGCKEKLTPSMNSVQVDGICKCFDKEISSFLSRSQKSIRKEKLAQYMKSCISGNASKFIGSTFYEQCMASSDISKSDKGEYCQCVSEVVIEIAEREKIDLFSAKNNDKKYSNDIEEMTERAVTLKCGAAH